VPVPPDSVPVDAELRGQAFERRGRINDEILVRKKPAQRRRLLEHRIRERRIICEKHRALPGIHRSQSCPEFLSAQKPNNVVRIKRRNSNGFAFGVELGLKIIQRPACIPQIADRFSQMGLRGLLSSLRGQIPVARHKLNGALEFLGNVESFCEARSQRVAFHLLQKLRVLRGLLGRCAANAPPQRLQ
jgi:hypothetical protein